MTSALRQLVRGYLSRPSPWGPPWWIYGVAFGVLNLIRQGVIVLAAPGLSTPLRVASWAATALVALGAVNTVAAVLRRRTPCPVHETAPAAIGPKEEAT